MPIVGTLDISGAKYHFGYDLLSQNVANNSSTVSFYGILEVLNNYIAWSSGTASVHTASAGLSTYYSKGSYTVVQSNFTFTHESDGNKTLTVGYAIDTTMPGGSANGFVNITLPKINRVAITNSVISQSNINNVEEWFKINYTKYIDNYTYKLRVSIPHVVELEKINYNTSGAEYTLSSTALNTLLDNMNKNTVQLGFAIETWNGNTMLSAGNELVVNGKLLDANPVFVDYDIEETNNTVKNLTGSTKNNVINVNGYSNIKATITSNNKAVALKRATMNKYRFAVDGNTPVDITYSDNTDVSGTIEGALTGVYNLYAIDSRENSTLITKQATTIIDYNNVYIDKQNCSFVRDNNQVGQNAILTLNGTFWNNNFGQANNSLSVSYKFKKADSSTWITGTTTITPTINENNFSFTGLIASDNQDGTWDLNSNYNLEITVSDALSSAVIDTLILNSAIPTLCLDKEGTGIMCAYDSNIGGALQVEGKIIDGGTIVWTNPNPTNAFSSQTINLSKSLDDCYEIIFRQNRNSSRYFSTGKIPVGYGTILEAYGNNYRPTGTTVSGNTIYFESASPDNNYAIPEIVISYKNNLFS